MKRFLWGFCLLFVVVGCALRPRPAADIPLLTPPDCITSLGEARDFERPIVVALTDSVIAENAPLPTNEAEQLVFAQLYETLVTIDCRGEVRPGLASDWSVSGDGREWRFRLRENARFSDGSHVTGESVRKSWESTNRLRFPLFDGKRFAGWIPLVTDSVRTQEDVVLVSLGESLGKDPFLFAHPVLSVVKRSRRGWPLGTGPYLLSVAHRDRVSLIPNPYRSETQRGRVPVTFLRRPGQDPRDVLSEAPAALLTREKRVLDYARRLAEYPRNLPGCRRVYYLLSAAIPDEANRDADYIRNLNRLREELARDVMVSESLPVTDQDDHPLIVWGTASWMATRHNVAWDESWSLPLVFPASDENAQSIAERLVALGASEWDSGGPGAGELASPLKLLYPEPSTAQGLSGTDFLASVGRGGDWGFIVSMFGYEVELKREADRKFGGLAWFELQDHAQAEPDSLAAALPLVITQSRLILKRGLVDIVSDGIGNFHFYRAGWTESAGAVPERVAQ